MDGHEQFWQAEARLAHAHDHLQRLHGEQADRRRTQPPEPQDDRGRQDRHGEGDGEVGGPAVHVLENLGVEPVLGARCLSSELSPACGPDPVVRTPTTTVIATTTTVKNVRPVSQRGDSARRRPLAEPDAVDKHRGDGDQADRDDEVHSDDVGVQPGEHRDPADDPPGRGCRAQAKRDSQKRSRRSPPHPDHRQERGDRHEHEHEGEHAVGELDDAVNPELRCGHEGVGRAPRPGRTAETGGGESHGASGAHQHHLENKREPPQHPHAAIDRSRQPAARGAGDQ